jgi:hypothetical protein
VIVIEWLSKDSEKLSAMKLTVLCKVAYLRSAAFNVMQLPDLVNSELELNICAFPSGERAKILLSKQNCVGIGRWGKKWHKEWEDQPMLMKKKREKERGREKEERWKGKIEEGTSERMLTTSVHILCLNLSCVLYSH